MWPWQQPHTSTPYQPPTLSTLTPHQLGSVPQPFPTASQMPYLSPSYPSHPYTHSLTDYQPSVGYSSTVPPSLPQPVHAHRPAVWTGTPLPTEQMTATGSYQPGGFGAEDVHPQTMPVHLQPTQTSPIAQHGTPHVLPPSGSPQAPPTGGGAYAHPQVASSPFSVAYLLREQPSHMDPTEMLPTYSSEQPEEDMAGDSVSPTFPPTESPDSIRPFDSAYPQPGPTHIPGYQPELAPEGPPLGGNKAQFTGGTPSDAFPSKLPSYQLQSELEGLSAEGDKLTISLPPEEKPFSPPELIPDSTDMILGRQDTTEEKEEESHHASHDPQVTPEQPVSPQVEGERSEEEDSPLTSDIALAVVSPARSASAVEEEGISPENSLDQSLQDHDQLPEDKSTDEPPPLVAEEEPASQCATGPTQNPTHSHPSSTHPPTPAPESLPKRLQPVPPPLVRSHLEYTSEDDDVFLPNSPNALSPEPVAKQSEPAPRQPAKEEGKERSPAPTATRGECCVSGGREGSMVGVLNRKFDHFYKLYCICWQPYYVNQPQIASPRKPHYNHLHTTDTSYVDSRGQHSNIVGFSLFLSLFVLLLTKVGSGQ